MWCNTPISIFDGLRSGTGQYGYPWLSKYPGQGSAYASLYEYRHSTDYALDLMWNKILQRRRNKVEKPLGELVQQLISLKFGT